MMHIKIFEQQFGPDLYISLYFVTFDHGIYLQTFPIRFRVKVVASYILFEALDLLDRNQRRAFNYI